MLTLENLYVDDNNCPVLYTSTAKVKVEIDVTSCSCIDNFPKMELFIDL